MLSTKYEVLMNLITHNRNMMFYQNISHRGKLFLRPHTPHRIMRIAKQEQLNVVIYDLTFKILQIYVITVVITFVQVVADHLSTIVGDHLRKRIIHRLLQHHGISRLRIRLYRHCQRKNNARRFDKPFFLNVPVVMFFHPRPNRLKIRRLHFTVAKYAMLRALYHRVLNIRRRLKIHICHPQWEHIFRHTSSFCKIIF